MIRYIENDKQKGIEYDFTKLNKLFKKLKVPKNVYTPIYMPFQKSKWFVLLSERSRGKTTNLLLYGMIMYQEYGTQIQYIRQRKDHIAPKRAGELFKTILEFGYIEKITGGQYNSCIYKSKRWYFCLRDQDGNEIERDNNHFMYMLSLDEADTYKSSYNAPFGDFIIYDEFLNNRYYMQNEFVILTDLIKTIIRDRLSPLIILSANMVDKHSIYFNELDVYDDIQKLQSGENKIVTTPKGTNVYLEILSQGELTDKNKKASNRAFFGFKNPLLANITGENWAIDNYPHIIREEREVILNNRFIFFNNKLVKIEIVENERLGIHAILHWATNLYDDSIIYTNEEITDKRYRFRFGSSKLDRFIWSLHKQNLFFYASNDLGSFIDSYIKTVSRLGGIL